MAIQRRFRPVDHVERGVILRGFRTLRLSPNVEHRSNLLVAMHAHRV